MTEKKPRKSTRIKIAELGNEPEDKSKKTLDLIFSHIKENKVVHILISDPTSAIDYDPQSKSITQRISFLVLLKDLNA